MLVDCWRGAGEFVKYNKKRENKSLTDTNQKVGKSQEIFLS